MSTGYQISIFVFSYQGSFPNFWIDYLLLHKVLISVIDLDDTLYQRYSNIDLTSMDELLLNSDWVSCTMGRIWDRQESPSMKADWHLVNRFLLWKWEKKKSKSLSKKLENIDKKFIGLFKKYFASFLWTWIMLAIFRISEKQLGLVKT